MVESILEYTQLFAQYLLSPAIVLFGISKILKLGEIKKDFEIIKTEVQDLKTRTNNIVTNITVIKTHLVDKSGVSAALFQTMSPISLTPTGKTLIQEIEFDEHVNKHLIEISSVFAQNKVTTLLRLDELSTQVVNDLYENKKLSNYENEAFKRGISLEVLLRACALYLREFMANKLGISA